MLKMSMKQMFLGSVKADKTVVYTVPAGNKESVIKDLTVYNNDPSKAVTVKIYIADTLFVNQTMAPNDTLFPDREWTMVLLPGQTIAVETSLADAVQVIISGAETIEVADS